MNEATTPQKDFLLSLLRDREVPADLRSELDTRWSDLTKAEASVAIGTLKGLPFATRTSANADVLAKLPKSFYAIPSHIANVILKDEHVDNDYMFVVVAEYMGARYMRKVTGNVGGFMRHKMTPQDVRTTATLLSSEPLGFIKKFGELYSVCSKCGAELTTEKSRKALLGPDCAKMLGVRY